MPVFLAALMGGLMAATGSIVGRVMIALGIGVVTYSGMSLSLDYLKTQAIDGLLGMGPDVVGMLVTLKVGQSISVVFSAMLARLVITGLQGDTMKAWVLK